MRVLGCWLKEILQSNHFTPPTPLSYYLLERKEAECRDCRRQARIEPLYMLPKSTPILPSIQQRQTRHKARPLIVTALEGSVCQSHPVLMQSAHHYCNTWTRPHEHVRDVAGCAECPWEGQKRQRPQQWVPCDHIQ